MFCNHCRKMVLEGDDCPACGKPIAALRPPPTDFDKKGDLHEKTTAVRNATLTPSEFCLYLEEERGKIVLARQKLAEVEESHLETAILSWEQALGYAEQWVQSGNDLMLQSSLALATQADAQLKFAVLADWEKTRDWIKAEQAVLRLASESPPTRGSDEISFYPNLH